MAMTAESSSNHHSPRGGGDGGVDSPRLRRKHLPSPWNQVVRGEPEPAPAANQPQSPPPLQSTPPPAPAAAPEQATSSLPLLADDVHVVAAAAERSDANSNNAASTLPKKPAWKKPPVNEGTAAAATTVVGPPLMGDSVAWPELCKASKPASKSASSAESSSPPRTAVTEGSNTNSQAPAAVTHPPRRPILSSNTPSPNPTPHPTAPARPRPNKRGGGGTFHPPSGPPIVSPPPPPPPPPPPLFPLFQVAPNAYQSMMSPVVDPSMRELRPNWDGRPVGGFPSQPRPINEHRNSSRRSNFGSHPRGEGHRDRGNYGTGRDVNAQSHRANSRGFMRSPPPAPNPPPFLHHAPPGRPIMAPLPYPDMTHLYYSPSAVDPFGVRMFFPNGPPLPVFYPVAEPPQHALVRQIEYYFSDGNLEKDDFLKSNMDCEGWVPISLIASFPRVKGMTGGDSQLILNCLKVSTLVEVQDERIRRRNEWMKWLRAPGQFSSEGGSPSSAASSQNALAGSFQNMTVVEAAASQSDHADGQRIENTTFNQS